MSLYTFTSQVANIDSVTSRIKAVPSLAPLLVFVEQEGVTFRVYTLSDLSAENQATLSQIFSTEVPPDQLLNYVKSKILAAMEFGRNLIAEYGASNTIKGLTIPQVRQVSEAAQGLLSACNTGSLYVAIDELNKIGTPVYDKDNPEVILVDSATILAFRHKIEDYLGIPRS